MAMKITGKKMKSNFTSKSNFTVRKMFGIKKHEKKIRETIKKKDRERMSE